MKPLIKAPTLSIELVPKTAWYSNVRSEVSSETWQELARETYRAANYHCEICGGQGPRHPVECHEIWHYDDERKIQHLEGLVALCPACHEVKHIGRAQIVGRFKQAVEQLRAINQWDLDTALRYIEQSFRIWAWRSQFDWRLEAEWLQSRGVRLRQKPRVG